MGDNLMRLGVELAYVETIEKQEVEIERLREELKRICEIARGAGGAGGAGGASAPRPERKISG
jgi:hypothetical protein